MCAYLGTVLTSVYNRELRSEQSSLLLLYEEMLFLPSWESQPLLQDV